MVVVMEVLLSDGEYRTCRIGLIWRGHKAQQCAG
jgi:hypothetical protein